MYKTDFRNQFVKDHEKLNKYELIYVHNRNDTYYLTRSVLIDSAFAQNAPTFFYNILRMDRTRFNDSFHSFAYLKFDRYDVTVVHLYLNVDPVALTHIINYIQTDEIDGPEIYRKDYQSISKIVELAATMEMPKLVEKMKALEPTDEQFEKFVNFLGHILSTLMHGWDIAHKQYPILADLQLPRDYNGALTECIDEHRDLLRQWHKQTFHHEMGARYQFFIRLFTSLMGRRIMETLNVPGIIPNPFETSSNKDYAQI